jgi:hypothetical protein
MRRGGGRDPLFKRDRCFVADGAKCRAAKIPQSEKRTARQLPGGARYRRWMERSGQRT